MENIGGYYVIDNQGTMTIIKSGKVYNNTANSNGLLLIRNGGQGSSKTANKLIIARIYNFIAIKNDEFGVLEITGTMASEKESEYKNWTEGKINRWYYNR